MIEEPTARAQAVRAAHDCDLASDLLASRDGEPQHLVHLAIARALTGIALHLTESRTINLDDFMIGGTTDD